MIQSGLVIDNKYTIIKKIGEGSISTVWLSQINRTNTEVAIKILNNNYITDKLEDIIRFRHEISTIIKQQDKTAPRILDFGSVLNSHYIVMTYYTGKDLFTHLKEKKAFTISDIIEIILKICMQLKEMHQFNIIHKDLKPTKIIVDYHHNEFHANVLDFGMAQVKDFKQLNKDDILGTLSYMSPEQCGVIKKTIDERSDLYSLGIIFYELLTGEKPFTGDNITTILHQQIAKTPEQLSSKNSAIPDILNRIVHKLLEKEPEKRYQSASGLIVDLEKYKNGQLNFTLGLDDKHIKLSYSSPIIDREKELIQLQNLFKRAKEGKGQISLIKGDAGTGKTRLVEEFKKDINPEEGIVLEGKCFIEKNTIPYWPFKDILNNYVSSFSSQYSEERKKMVRDSLKESIGNLGQIILTLNPAMAEILKDCPPLAPLDPEKENARFLNVSSDFFCKLARLEKTILFIIDDIQWIDQGSLNLLKELTDTVSDYPILLVLTYRENEISNYPGLIDFIKKGENPKLPFHDIYISGFDKLNMNKFISKLLFQREENTLEITEYIFNKSKGNQYFAIEILKLLVEEQAVIYDGWRWVIHKNRIKELQVFTSIVDTLITKISMLNETEVSVLSMAALIGKELDLHMILGIMDVPNEDIIIVIDKACRLQLLEENQKKRGTFQFVHNRIVEAFKKNLNPEIKKTYHLLIASAIEELHEDNIDKVIFDLAYHYIEGENETKSLEYAYLAGLKAEKNYANEETVKYLLLCIKLLEKQNKKGNNQWIHCNEIVGNIYLSMGSIDKGIELFTNLLPYLKTMKEQLNAYKNISYAYLKKEDWKNCEDYSLAGLKILGEKLPTTRFSVFFTVIFELVKQLIFRVLPPRIKFSKKEIKELGAGNIVWLYYILSWSYSLNGSNKISSTILKMLNFAESKIGTSKEKALCYMVLGVLLAEKAWNKPALRYHKKALDIRQELHDDWGIAQSYTTMGFFYKVNTEFDKCITSFQMGTKLFTQMGISSELGASISGLAGAYVNIADYDNALVHTDHYFNLADKIDANFGRIVAWMHHVFIYTEMGKLDKAEYYGLKATDLAYKETSPYLSCISGTALGRLYNEKNEYKTAQKYLESVKLIFEKNKNFLKEYSTPLYPYLAESYILEYKTELDSLTPRTKKKMLHKIKKTCLTALHWTKTWKNYHMCSLRAYAKYCMIVKKYDLARKYFNKSITLAAETGRKYEKALSLYEYALFLNEKGTIYEYRNTLEKSYEIFNSIKAEHYKQKISTLLGIEDKSTDSSDRFIKELKYYQRLSSLISLTQDISSTLNLDILLQKVIKRAVEVTGAQRGALFIVNHETEELEFKISENVISKNFTQITIGLVNQVYKTKQKIITTDAEKDQNLKNFPELANSNFKSVLCVPIIHGSKVEGVCFLDNPLSIGVFSEEDAKTLEIFMSQVAISVLNAKIYVVIDQLNRSLEKKVEERTRELKMVNKELAKKNMFKSKFLANMSHEIRTPLNSILGFNEQLSLKTFDVRFNIMDINDAIIESLESNEESKKQFTETLECCKTFNRYFETNDIDIKQFYYYKLNELFNKELTENTTKTDTFDLVHNKIEEIRSLFENEEESIQKCLRFSNNSGNYLLELVNAILDIAKIEAGKIVVFYQSVELKPYIEDIINNANSYCKAKQKDSLITISYAIDKSINPLVIFDHKKIKQVLLNLLSNAIKFTEAGKVNLNVAKEDGFIVFSVQDNGIGIKQEDFNKLFVEFERSTNTEEIEGVGLGLTLSKKLIELHGGTIEVISEIGRGSNFKFYIPDNLEIKKTI